MPTLQAKIRELKGKKVKALRKNGQMPVILYGGKTKSSIPLSVSSADFSKLARSAGESAIIGLEIENGEKRNVLIHDIAFDPVSDAPIHADFYEVDMSKPISAH